MCATNTEDPDETSTPTPTAPSKSGVHMASATHPQVQSPQGLLTRARKARADKMAPPPLPPVASTSASVRPSTSASVPIPITESAGPSASASAGPSTMPYRLRKKTLSAAIMDSEDDDAAAGDTAEQAKEMPPGFVVPVVNVQQASPDKDKEKKAPPFATGDVRFW